MTRVPVSLQVTQTECGLCAARSLLASYGQDVPITELRAVIEPGRDGLSLKQIAGLLRTRGMQTQIYRVGAMPGFDLVDAPFIAFWKGYHFVVVESLTARSAVLMDPMVGRTVVTREEFAEHFSGYILVARPGPEFPRARRPLLAAWRGKPIWPRSAGRSYALLVAASLAVFGFTLSIPLLTQLLVNSVAHQGFDLTSALLMVAGTAAGYVAVLIGRTYVSTRVVRAVSWQLLSSAFEHLVRLPIAFFMTRPPGELMYRLNSLHQVRDLIATRLVQGVLDAVSALVLLGYVYWVAVPLGLAVTGIVLGVVALLALSQRLVRSAGETEVHHNARTQSIQMDAVVSVTSVRMGGYADRYLADWRQAFRQSQAAMIRRMRIQQGWIGSAVSGVQAFAPLAVMIVGLYWVGTGAVDLGSAVAVQGVAALLFGLSASVFQSWTDATVAGRYLERADDIWSTPVESTGGSRTTLPHHGVRLRDVSFAFTDHTPPVLSGIDVDIAPGSTVAVVGESGSGKTTLGKVICSLYEPSGGTLQYGGVDAREYDKDALRSRIGYIPQEIYLHNRTLVENLTLGTDIDPDEAEEFCRRLPFLDFVDELPMGYRTVVSEMGANFSGGQRQRVAIGKALLRRPSLLVLDEATSALDNANQRLVHEAVAALDCTQVIIAHRLSTVVGADQILVLAGGRIAQVGTHDELSRDEGVYARLFADLAGGHRG